MQAPSRITSAVFTGCDSVSAFSGIETVQPLKLMRKNKELQSILENLAWSVSPELCKGLESFVCAL